MLRERESERNPQSALAVIVFTAQALRESEETMLVIPGPQIQQGETLRKQADSQNQNPRHEEHAQLFEPLQVTFRSSWDRHKSLPLCPA